MTAFKMAANKTFTINTTGIPASDKTRSVTTDANGHLPGTIGLDMGSFSEQKGYPEYGIVIGHCTDHVWTPNQYFKVRAKGIEACGATSISFKAIAKDARGAGAKTPVYGNTGYNFCQMGIDGQTITNASFHFNPSTNSIGLHNYTTNVGLVLHKPNSSNRAADVANFMPGMCTDYEHNNAPAVCKINLGSDTRRWENIYAKTSTFSDSDERLKQDIADIPEAVLRAWERVGFKHFKFIEAVKKKGSSARLHVGVIAQRVMDAFAAEGLDAFSYGLIGHDVTPAKEEVWREYDVQHPAEYDDKGNITQEAWTEHIRELAEPAEPAMDIYSIRYEEALAMEAAYQRRRADRLEANLAAIEKRLAALESKRL